MKIASAQKKVIVIGGGISGLATAFNLHRKGFQVEVLERRDRPGGIIRSERQGGFLLEHAATCVFNFLPEVDLFCRTLGLEGQMVLRQEAAKRRYLLKGGKPVPVPITAGGFLRTSLISPQGKIRLLMEPFVPRGPQAGDRESVAQFIIRRFGREIFEQTIEPFVSGTLAGDPERACLRSVFSQFAAMEDEFGSILKGALLRKLRGIRTTSCGARVFSFVEGMSAITDALAAHLGDGFLPQRRVESIRRGGTRWSVTAVAADGVVESYDADALVLATPAGVAGELLQPLSPDLASLLKGLVYSPMVVSYLGFHKSQVDHPLDGIGCLVPKKELGYRVLGSLWPTTLFSGRGPEGQALFMNYMGGTRHPDMLAKSDAELQEISLADIRQMGGVRGVPLFSKVIRHKRALPQYNLGHQMFLSGVEENLKSLPGLFLAGNYLQGVSVRVCIANGYEIADRVAQCLNPTGTHPLQAVSSQAVSSQAVC